MKKETPAPEQHPVDAYFREQEAKIPVAFDPAHWNALQAMLDEVNPGSTPVPGTRVSDLSPNLTNSAFTRFFGALLIFVFLAAVPSANPAPRQTRGAVAPELSGFPETGPYNTGQVSIPGTRDTETRTGGTQTPANPAATPKQPQLGWPLLPAATYTTPTGTDTVSHHFYVPAVLPPDSLYRQIDSLSIRKGLRAVQDSMAAQKKKKKHLFW
ncbi:MAG: hypothetical protein HUU01_17570 [Saprospiraceae bacterium]|nr:hypothetical protein [Saprospiraceae bacterium]